MKLNRDIEIDAYSLSNEEALELLCDIFRKLSEEEVVDAIVSVWYKSGVLKIRDLLTGKINSESVEDKSNTPPTPKEERKEQER